MLDVPAVYSTFLPSVAHAFPPCILAPGCCCGGHQTLNLHHIMLPGVQEEVHLHHRR